VKLFILRHGEAEMMASRDEQRQLTERGRDDVAAVLAARAEDLQGVQRILVSPYVRAQETAEIVADFLPHLNLHTTPFLVPESNPIEFIRWLNSQCYGDLGLEEILLISHQPLVGTLVNGLSGSDQGLHAMGTANLAALEMDILAYGLADLLWLSRPNELN